MFNRILGAAAAVLIAIAPSASAWAQDDDILQYLVNNPSVDSWQVLGVARAPRPQRADGVLGDRAVRVVARRSNQPWDVAAQMPISGAIKQGDTILLAVWARLAVAPEGASSSRIPLRVQENTPPYAALAEDAGSIGPAWGMIYASGVAAKDHGAGSTNLSVHLAGADQTVELGPALLLNFGQNYDPAKLPRNAQ